MEIIPAVVTEPLEILPLVTTVMPSPELPSVKSLCHFSAIVILNADPAMTSSVTRARMVYCDYDVNATDARMPTIATTIINSISVKPRTSRFIVFPR